MRLKGNKVIGVHQVNDKVISHYKWDLRVPLAYTVWVGIVAVTLFVVMRIGA